MHCLRATAIAVTLAHSALLASVFFSSSLDSGAYVSTEIHSRLYFSVLLTALVLLEAALGSAYAFASPHSTRETKVVTAVSLLAAAAGWATLASTPESSPFHTAGAAVFIAATSMCSLLFIADATHAKPCLLIAWTASTCTAITFAVLHFAQQYSEAAIAEWAAFLSFAVTFLAFFSLNPAPAPTSDTQRGPESTRPLLSTP